MKIIKIEQFENGGHLNQEFYGTLAPEDIPEGWAVIPEEMVIPDTFPFVNITVDETGEYPVVTAMTAGVVPEPEPIPDPPPTELERMEAQVTYTAMMTDTLLPEPEV